MSNFIKSGTTILTSYVKGDVRVGVDGESEYGPTENTGFYNGITPPVGGYTIYVLKESQGPSIHVAYDDSQCIFFLKSFGSTGTTISDVLAWSDNQSNIWVTSSDLTANDLIITPTSTPTPTPTPTNTSTPTPTNTPTSTQPEGLLINLDSGNLTSYSGTGSTWYDLVGTANNATLFNSPTYSSSYNGILQFDDASLEYGTIPNIGNLSNWTVEVWFRLTTSLTGKVTSIVSNQFNNSVLNFSIGTNNMPTNSNLAVGFYNLGSGGWKSTTGFVPVVGSWYQVVGTYDGSTIRQYVNGVASGGTLNTIVSSQSGGEIRLMRRWDEILSAGNFVDGDLSIVKIYNTVLSSSDILQSYNNTYTRFLEPTPTPTTTLTPTNTSTPTPTPTNTPTNTPTPTNTSAPINGLQFYLQTAPSSGTVWTDSTGNGKNATINGDFSYVSNNGGGIKLNNTDYTGTGYISVPYNISSNTATIEIVASFNNTSHWATIWGNEAYNLSKGYFAYMGATTSLNWGSPTSNTTNVTITASNAIRHWVFVINGTTKTLYLNGSQFATATTNNPTGGYATSEFLFGARHTNAGTGATDKLNNTNSANQAVFYQMRVYNTALSSSDVTTNFNEIKSTYGL
jgi:hypothetical protein